MVYLSITYQRGKTNLPFGLQLKPTCTFAQSGAWNDERPNYTDEMHLLNLELSIQLDILFVYGLP